MDHLTPGGVNVVPANKNVARRSGDWDFYYDGYNVNEAHLNNHVLLRANSKNQLYDSKSGKMDAKFLKRHGLTPHNWSSQIIQCTLSCQWFTSNSHPKAIWCGRW